MLDVRLLGRDISRYSGLISDLTGDGVADLVSQNQYWPPGTVVWRATDPFPARAGVFPDSTFASWDLDGAADRPCAHAHGAPA